ncbi:CWF19-like protein 2 homolog [Episyrphus balteatus]|uniref:CWF19-like protein 2 homolog n=1 Tax=Episyrphus balteatus TaxID=286459 RepID=UPI002486BD02|nr:CWF19-like protein 2 homolog [Episyrphus balteatus]
MSQSDTQLAKEKALEDLRRIKEELLQRHKKSDKEKHKRKERSRSSSSEREIKEKHKHKERSQSSSPERQVTSPKKRSCSPEVTRDDWMTSSVLLKTFSKNKPLPKKQCTTYETYEPGKSTRELNPHWKDGGTGLPAFRKPKDDSDDDNYSHSRKYSSKSHKKGDWMKKTETKSLTEKKEDEGEKEPSSTSVSEKETGTEFLSDQQMNELGAKIMKAELLGNKDLADELKNKLNSARLAREQGNFKDKERSNNKNHRNSHSEKHRKSHKDVSSRTRRFSDDDEHDLGKKFAREASTTVDSSSKSKEKHKNFNEDFEDIFANPKDEKEAQREIRNQSRHNKKLNNCDKCFNSDKMNKELVVSVGKHVYLALPWHEGLQTNHCLIISNDHYTCSTDLDEDVWQEITRYRRVLTKLFAKRKQDVLFFETARYLHKRPHMVIQCVPSSGFEMAPFYFKKGIEESEYEWSKNKQLVTLKEKNLRKSIPNGLPYFWVHFGMDLGFAHVIENQEMFPLYFAQEIIGGMLTLDMRKWRSPRQEHNIKTKIKNLADLLKPYEEDLC